MLGKLTNDANLVDAVISGASGIADITRQEFSALSQHCGADIPVRSYTSMIGHSMESNFPAGIALAALSLKNQQLFPPFEEAEIASTTSPNSILVTSIGHWKGEGLGLLEKV
jgi:3-oxoacyl-[acyl-carrier-protein] synthase II